MDIHFNIIQTINSALEIRSMIEMNLIVIMGLSPKLAGQFLATGYERCFIKLVPADIQPQPPWIGRPSPEHNDNDNDNAFI